MPASPARRPEMCVYILRFASSGALENAFQVLNESERVASCTLEREPACVRFLAPAKHAERLVERIYLEGGLSWCSRHDVVDDSAGADF